MDDIQLMKKNLNAEKVFYNLNWHELVPGDSSDGSTNEVAIHQDSRSLTNKIRRGTINLHENKKNTSPISVSSVFYSDDEKESTNSRFVETREIFANSQKKNDNSSKVSSVTCNCLFPRECWISSTVSSLLNKYPGCKRKNDLKSKYDNEYIEEKEYSESAPFIDFKPPVDILYNTNIFVFLFFISGEIENFTVDFNVFSNILTVSGKKITYPNFTENDFLSHEIKEGYFERSFLLKKSVIKDSISYTRENGVIKIIVPFEEKE